MTTIAPAGGDVWTHGGAEEVVDGAELLACEVVETAVLVIEELELLVDEVAEVEVLVDKMLELGEDVEIRLDEVDVSEVVEAVMSRHEQPLEILEV